MKTRRRQNGSALLLSLWALLILSVAVFGLAKFINQGIDSVRDANMGLDAKALAYSGVTIALNPDVYPQTPALVADFGQNRGFKARMVGEGGKLNLNFLLAGEQPQRLDILKNYLRYRGLKFEQIQTLVDCMLDWVDPDNIKHLNGAEDEGDYHPANRPFQSLDEVAKVKGSRPLVTLPHWQDDFTLYSNGTIDLQSATVAVLSSLPGVGEARARLLVQYRQGPDKQDGTLDDHIFKDINEALSFLGYSGQGNNPLSGLVGLKDPTYHIISVGSSGKVDRQVEVVAQKVGTRPNILLWKEN